MAEMTISKRIKKLQNALVSARLIRLESYLQVILEEYHSEKAQFEAENEILQNMVRWWEVGREPLDLGEYEGLVIALAQIRKAKPREIVKESSVASNDSPEK